MKSESIRIQSQFTGICHIWMRNFMLFRRLWMVNIFWIVLEPLIVLLAIGYGVGAFVSNVQGISYIDFFFPGLLCISSMMVAFFESTYGNFSKLTYQKTYATMILTPLDPDQIVYGEIFWGATKGTISALGVTVIAAIFGKIDAFMMIPAMGIIFISSFMFAAFGLLVTTFVRNYDQIIYPASGLIVPMSLLSGTYFPLMELPFGVRNLAYLMPLRHSVLAVRGTMLGALPWWQILGHTLVLVTIGLVLSRWAAIRLRRKLIQ